MIYLQFEDCLEKEEEMINNNVDTLFKDEIGDAVRAWCFVRVQFADCLTYSVSGEMVDAGQGFGVFVVDGDRGCGRRSGEEVLR